MRQQPKPRRGFFSPLLPVIQSSSFAVIVFGRPKTFQPHTPLEAAFSSASAFETNYQKETGLTLCRVSFSFFLPFLEPIAKGTEERRNKRCTPPFNPQSPLLFYSLPQPRQCSRVFIQQEQKMNPSPIPFNFPEKAPRRRFSFSKKRETFFVFVALPQKKKSSKRLWNFPH